MKRFMFTLMAALFVVIAPVSAQAQQNVTVKFDGTKFSTNVAGYIGSGGGFKFTPTPLVPTPPPVTFVDFIAFCIDPTRTISVVGTYEYQFFSLGAFVAQNWGASNLANQSLSDLNFMASVASTYDVTGASVSNNAKQEQIWDTFTNGNTSAAFTGDFSQKWGVLANGKTQTMLVRVDYPGGDLSTVPEPSTYVLTASGLMALAVVARRRKTVTA